ncbi:hypothetical protein CCACVL1_28022 [Corchorus capsularis]|uniref:Uncharacterized protein n=1 Tax=Corchorus capsularis TaxID=210143 RepID=A0A1R3G7X4_COCAP|nr:hypothetical protein CCACVL1_28022 [Corchorus capsularis]
MEGRKSSSPTNMILMTQPREKVAQRKGLQTSKAVQVQQENEEQSSTESQPEEQQPPRHFPAPVPNGASKERPN